MPGGACRRRQRRTLQPEHVLARLTETRGRRQLRAATQRCRELEERGASERERRERVDAQVRGGAGSSAMVSDH